MKGFLFLATALTVGVFSASSAVWANDADSQALLLRPGAPTSLNIQASVGTAPNMDRIVANGFQISFPKEVKDVRMSFGANSVDPIPGNPYIRSSLRGANVFDKNWRGDHYIEFSYDNAKRDTTYVSTDVTPKKGSDGYDDFLLQKAAYDDFVSGKRDLSTLSETIASLSGSSVFSMGGEIYFPRLIRSKDGEVKGIGYFVASKIAESEEDVPVPTIDYYIAVRVSPNGGAVMTVSTRLYDTTVKRVATNDGLTEEGLDLPFCSGSIVAQRKARMDAWNTYAMGRSASRIEIQNLITRAHRIIAESVWWSGEGYGWSQGKWGTPHTAWYGRTDGDGGNGGYILRISKDSAVRECQDQILGEDGGFQCNEHKDLQGIRKIFELLASEKDESENLKKIWNAPIWTGELGLRTDILDVRNTGTGKYLVLGRSPQYAGSDNLELYSFEYRKNGGEVIEFYDSLSSHFSGYGDSEEAISRTDSDAKSGFRTGKFEDANLQSFFAQFNEWLDNSDAIIQESGVQP